MVQGCVCLFRDIILKRCFHGSQNFKLTWIVRFQTNWSFELLIYLQQKRVGEFDNSKNYFQKSLRGRSVAVS